MDKRDVIEARLVLARDAKQHFAGVEIVMQPGWHTIGVIRRQRHCAEFRFFGQSEPKTKIRVSGTVFFDDGAGGFSAMRA
ncbi:MAG: hypothetical protein CM15mP55_0510 [Hyphomicrobiales bacterium]|nr:MAG: hypothetical protein CM15mP55_0510 [Hyphomicrobiales bacterium]